jgi:hypothetical protein
MNSYQAKQNNDMVSSYQAKQNFMKDVPQAAPPPRRSFNFSANIQEEIQKRAAAFGGTQQQIIANPIASQNQGVDPALQKKERETVFQTPSAKNFHWSSSDQEIVDQIANSLGLAVDYLYANNLPYAQKYIMQANQLGGQLDQANDKQACLAIFNNCQGVMNQINPEGTHAVNTQDLQGQIKQAQEVQQQKEQAVTPQPVEPKNELAIPEKEDQKPGWKNTLSILPFVGSFTDMMPDQPSMYDSALNMALGDKWEDWKKTINWSLMGTGAVASYFLIKPMFKKKNPVEIPKPKPKKRKRRRKAIKRKPKIEKTEESEDE